MNRLKPNKADLRKEILDRRLSLGPEFVLSFSNQIQEKMISSPLWKGASSIALYSAIRNEVDTKLLFMRSLEEAKTVYFPKVEQGIQFYEVSDPEELQKGAWGLMEPKHGCEVLPDVGQLDLIVVPGVLFDERGYRLGYGRGFYDRFLEHFSKLKIGLAYDFQVIQSLPVEAWDQQVDLVMTPTREIHRS